MINSTKPCKPVKQLTQVGVLFVWLLTLTSQIAYAQQPEIFVHMAAMDSKDQRNQYEIELLQLALSLTQDQHPTPFKLQPTHQADQSGQTHVNLKRTEVLAIKGFYGHNFFIKFSARNDLLKQLHAVEFPLERGIVGYRVSFVANNNNLKPPNDLVQLSRHRTVQGIGWLDTQILKHNGINVFTVSKYDNMFAMIASQRAEYFFRGANEWLHEYRNFKPKYPKLVLEQNIALHYPMPRFYFTAKDNIANAQRVMRGLKLAYESGKFQQLWFNYYGESIKRTRLSQRHIIELDNPFIHEIDPQYQQYNFDIAELRDLEANSVSE
ncbi:hypothetical protein C2869_07715 [Saccharobesus litoralis]|uniref:Solute-binding protein family 3/N-terminal domain-containing protein n=1 Tax=Saccharobesus litoralis TaxID=2172099 RepID=A0A2S0VQ35_9ALTE|nr:hypothetical protein [Saccharobesus litoralis]AWB66326.1 hypothetical protein C2869_07715 [Saccharobesus litoralis]